MSAPLAATPWLGAPGVRAAAPADEVHERVPVDVRDRRSASAVCDDRLVHDQRCGKGTPPPARALPAGAGPGRRPAAPRGGRPRVARRPARSRAGFSLLRGPGISVRISITRVAATRGSLDEA